MLQRVSCFLAASGVLLLGLCPSAGAIPITQFGTYTAGLRSLGFPGDLDGIGSFLSFQKFGSSGAPAGAFLVSAEWRLTGTYSANAIARDCGTATLRVRITAADLAGTGGQDLEALDTDTKACIAVLGLGPTIDEHLAATDLDDFQGSGSFTQIVNVVYDLSATLPPTVPPIPSGVASITGGGSLTLVYEYSLTSVPAPSTLLLLALGIPLLGGVARRRQTRNC